jgi:uncharacterized membrane protein
MNKKHILIMILCCLIPVAGFAAVTLFKLPLNSLVYGAMILVCPIAMIFMMKSMFQDHKPDSSKSDVPGCHSETIDVVAKEK